MGVFDFLTGTKNKIESAKKEAREETVRKLRAEFDVCQKNNEQLKRWQLAKEESVGQSVSSDRRQSILYKARYEYLNNPHIVGITNLVALRVIGTGVTLRMRARKRNGENKSPFNAYIQNLHWDWCRKAHSAITLQTAVRSFLVDGESFLRLSTNPKREIAPFNISVIDPQRIGNPGGVPSTRLIQDGIKFDEYGNREAYFVYKHPEQSEESFDPEIGEWVPADQILHIYRPLLPEQVRGFSWFAQDLIAIGGARDYRRAVQDAATLAASWAVVLKTTLGYGIPGEDPIGDQLPGIRDPWLTMHRLDMPRSGLVYLPPSAEANQLKAEQPCTTYKEYNDSHIQELGMSVNMPYSHASGSSKDSNFASAKLDGQTLDLNVKVIQSAIEEMILNPFFAIWYTISLPYIIDRYEGDPSDILTLDEINDCRQHGLGVKEKDISLYQWRWENPPEVDEVKAANAAAIRIDAGISTREMEIEKTGRDPEDVFEQIEKEKKMFPETEKPTEKRAEEEKEDGKE